MTTRPPTSPPRGRCASAPSGRPSSSRPSSGPPGSAGSGAPPWRHGPQTGTRTTRNSDRARPSSARFSPPAGRSSAIDRRPPAAIECNRPYTPAGVSRCDMSAPCQRRVSDPGAAPPVHGQSCAWPTDSRGGQRVDDRAPARPDGGLTLAEAATRLDTADCGRRVTVNPSSDGERDLNQWTGPGSGTRVSGDAAWRRGPAVRGDPIALTRSPPRVREARRDAAARRRGAR